MAMKATRAHRQVRRRRAHRVTAATVTVAIVQVLPHRQMVKTIISRRQNKVTILANQSKSTTRITRSISRVECELASIKKKKIKQSEYETQKQ